MVRGRPHQDLEHLSTDELYAELECLAEVFRRRGEVHDAALIEEVLWRLTRD